MKKVNQWFTSDLHFGHKPILNEDFDDRPFKDLQHMEDELVRRWNALVQPQDIVYIVGDVFFCGSTKAKQIMSRLNGVKVLITGNHDGNFQNSINCGFDVVCEKLILKIAGEEVLLSHYPYKHHWLKNWIKEKILRMKMPRYMDRRPDNKGGWLIHGHTHEKAKLQGKMIHVGCMAWGYKPVSLSTIESIIATGRVPDDYANFRP